MVDNVVNDSNIGPFRDLLSGFAVYVFAEQESDGRNLCKYTTTAIGTTFILYEPRLSDEMYGTIVINMDWPI